MAEVIEGTAYVPVERPGLPGDAEPIPFVEVEDVPFLAISPMAPGLSWNASDLEANTTPTATL